MVHGSYHVFRETATAFVVCSVRVVTLTEHTMNNCEPRLPHVRSCVPALTVVHVPQTDIVSFVNQLLLRFIKILLERCAP